jgi:hypothetical protein
MGVEVAKSTGIMAGEERRRKDGICKTKKSSPPVISLLHFCIR